MDTPTGTGDLIVVDTRNEAGTSCADQTNGAFDSLPVGASVLIVADHDPQPLYWMLRAERGETTFAWDSIEAGPARWQARVTRTA